MNIFQLFLVSLNILNVTHARTSSISHEQVHIALGTDETEMVVTWTTLRPLSDVPVVQFGLNERNITRQINAETSPFQKDGANFYTHRALLSNLSPATQYYYRVGSKGSSWSGVFKFRTIPRGNKWNPRFAIYGDLGYQNEESLPFLTKDVQQKNEYDVIFHIGDFAYNLNERDGQQGHDFMRSIEKVSSQVPYMTCPGNHEDMSNFSHYDARFSMIGDRQSPDHQAPLTQRINNHFHSMDIGPAHIILFSTEYYYFTEYGWDQIERQFRFLEDDLKRANANRAERPWIIAMGHRPLYCLRLGDRSCNYRTLERRDIRQGVHMHGSKTSPRQYGLEDLFFKYGVDLQFYGHEHFYGRLLPLYNYTILSGGRDNPYDNPRGPVHIITGSAGNRELHPQFNPHLKKWVADHQFDYGYTRVVFKSRNHIVLEQTSDDKGGIVTDQIDIIKGNDQPRWLL